MVYHAAGNIADVGDNQKARIQKVDWKLNAQRFPAAIGINRPIAVRGGE